MESVRLQTLTPKQVRAVILRAADFASERVDVNLLEEFCASVDWSGEGAEDAPAADLVDALNLLTSEYREGALEESALLARLTQLLDPAAPGRTARA
jgi:hypothetical protein